MKKTWTHKKHGKKKFLGFYKYKKRAKRIFVLVQTEDKAQDQYFNSPQAAISQGWICK